MKKKPHHKRKLTDRQIRAIFIDSKRSHGALSEQYGVVESWINAIKHRKAHSALTADLPNYMIRDFRNTNSGNRKLARPQIKDIFISPLNTSELVAAYGIDRRTVERIKNRDIHKTVTEGL